MCINMCSRWDYLCKLVFVNFIRDYPRKQYIYTAHFICGFSLTVNIWLLNHATDFHKSGDSQILFALALALLVLTLSYLSVRTLVSFYSSSHDNVITFQSGPVDSDRWHTLSEISTSKNAEYNPFQSSKQVGGSFKESSSRNHEKV